MSLKLTGEKLIQQFFPNSRHQIQFAFVGNHINRYRKLSQKIEQRKSIDKPQLDLIMAVEDIKDFHKQNLEDNKDHYTMFVRFTQGKILNLIQTKGAKIHFNEINVPKDISQTDEQIPFRYGIIQQKDLINDLRYWETLLVSSMMQRPTDQIIEPQGSASIINELQIRNLKSAIAFAALNTSSNEDESKLYEEIVEIPQYDSKWLQLLDKEDDESLVKDNLQEFQQLYHPIIKSHFKDHFEITNDGKFIIDHKDDITRRYLLSNLNDNVLQNVDKGFKNVKKYHNSQQSHQNQPHDKDLSKIQKIQAEAQEQIKKDPLEYEERVDVIDSILDDPIKEQNQQLYRSVDKILVLHRNSKLFLFMLTGPFFVLFTAFKYTIKLGVFMYIWDKQKKQQEETNKNIKNNL